MASPLFSPLSVSDGQGLSSGAETTTSPAQDEASRVAEASPEYRFSVEEFSTPSTSWLIDDFALDPGYVASREELRCLMLNTAQTAPPSPAYEGSFVSGLDSQEDEDRSSVRHETSHLLSQGRRIEYLKNYISVVAPWVSLLVKSPKLNLSSNMHSTVGSSICLTALMPLGYEFLS